MKTLIIGFGNELRGDDGVGQAIAHELENRYQEQLDVEVLACVQLLPEHALQVAQADRVIFVDANVELPGGGIRCDSVLTRTRATARPPAHSLNPEDLVTLSSWLYGHIPRQALLLSVGASEFDLSEHLSPPVSAAIPRAMGLIEKALAGMIVG